MSAFLFRCTRTVAPLLWRGNDGTGSVILVRYAYFANASDNARLIFSGPIPNDR